MPPSKISRQKTPKTTDIDNSLMVVTYSRVSDPKQGISKLGLESYRKTLDDWIEQHGLIEIAAYVEIESGKKVVNRPVLKDAIACARLNSCTLLIPKLDRLARNVHFITGLIESGVKFKALDMPFADVTMIQMFAVFAEYEGRMISERTSAALQALKRRGVKLGGARGVSRDTIDKMREGRYRHIREAEIADGQAIRVIRELLAKGITMPRVICRILIKKNIRRTLGGKWFPRYVIPFIRRHRLMPINDLNRLQEMYQETEGFRREVLIARRAELAKLRAEVPSRHPMQPRSPVPRLTSE